MKRNLQYVPYGYEPPPETHKGTLVYYDSFEQISDEQLLQFVRAGENLSFQRLVLYPLHEDTVKRMGTAPVSAFHKRVQRLQEWQDEHESGMIAIEAWEGKRKKYTPIEAAIRFVTEKYKKPLFFYMSPETANVCATFSSFDEWIKNIRLLLIEEPQTLHPKLAQYSHRWSTIQRTNHLDSKVDKGFGE